MNTRLVNSAAGVINAALTQNRTAAGIALALESAQMLQSPETAAELESARVDGQRMIRAEQRRAELEAVLSTHRQDDQAEIEQLRTRLAGEELSYERLRVALESAKRGRRELRARVAELEAAPTTGYRAEHPDSGITLGHYGTETAARAHCEATERRSWPTGTSLAFDWIEDDEDRVAELVVTAGQNEESTTGYIVTALELDSEYDEGADE
ncbi:hypothetical protein [Streptomyces sp. NPDC058299]|uniref:hypothetical protein n=1 Tax=unclassified Streptomyces TaxID=2593676 RepID=UPI0036E11347